MNLNPFKKSPGPMDESRFWKIIEDNRGDAARVESVLSRIAPDQIAEFQRIYWNHHNQLHRWDVWGAAFVINGGCGDDGFHYFKAWVIGKGRKAFETALASPDDLGRFVSGADADEGCDNESLNYAAENAFETVTGGELAHGSIEGQEPSGTPWDEEEVDGLYPTLAAKFG